ncbi:MAG: GNAT family N-acetyltransferase [Hyphomicrobiaceae bacterium]
MSTTDNSDVGSIASEHNLSWRLGSDRSAVSILPKPNGKAVRSSELTTKQGESVGDGADQSPLFSQSWWWDAANPGEWDIVEYREDGRVIGALPFRLHKRYHLRCIRMPTLARVIKPKIEIASEKPSTRNLKTKRTIQHLVDSLPRFDQFDLVLPPNSGLELPFVLSGFNSISSYTYTCGADTVDDLWSLMHRKTRNNINCGKRSCEVELHYDLDRFMKISSDPQSIKKGADYNDYAAIERIWNACRARDSAAIITTNCDTAGDIASAIIVWDNSTLYYWLAARLPQAQRGGANSILIWEAIQVAKRKNLIFDADGYYHPAHGLFLAGFGLKPVIRPNISSSNRQWRFAELFKPKMPS